MSLFCQVLYSNTEHSNTEHSNTEHSKIFKVTSVVVLCAVRSFIFVGNSYQVHQRQPCHLVAIKQKYHQTQYNVTQSLTPWLFAYAFSAGWHNRLLY